MLQIFKLKIRMSFCGRKMLQILKLKIVCVVTDDLLITLCVTKGCTTQNLEPVNPVFESRMRYVIIILFP